MREDTTEFKVSDEVSNEDVKLITTDNELPIYFSYFSIACLSAQCN